jgi:hypothetical protein
MGSETDEELRSEADQLLASFEATRECGVRIAEKLSRGTRSMILRIKAACRRHPEYRRGFCGADIYSPVLDYGVASIDKLDSFGNATVYQGLAPDVASHAAWCCSGFLSIGDQPT